MEHKARVTWLDTAKAIGIYLMLVSHASLGEHPLNVFIFGFHMPLFFLIYGVQVARERAQAKPLRTVLLNGARAYLVPYFVFALLIDGAHLDRHLTLHRIWLILYGTHASRSESVSLGALWFLPCLFLASLGYHLWCRLLRGKSHAWYCAASCAALLPLAGTAWRFRNGTAVFDLPWDINVACAGLCFILLGSMLRPLLMRPVAAPRWLAAPAGAALLAAGQCVNLYNVQRIRAQGFLFVNMGESIYGSMPLFLLSAGVSSLGILACSVAVDCRPLQFVGRNTIGILLLQLMADRFVRRIPFSAWLPLPWWNIAIATGNLLLSLLMTCAILFICPPLLGRPWVSPLQRIRALGRERAHTAV